MNLIPLDIIGPIMRGIVPPSNPGVLNQIQNAQAGICDDPQSRLEFHSAIVSAIFQRNDALFSRLLFERYQKLYGIPEVIGHLYVNHSD